MTHLRLLLIVALLLGALAMNLRLTTRDSAIFVALSPSVALTGDVWLMLKPPCQPKQSVV